MTTTTEPAAAGHRAQRLASTGAAALTALLALWLLSCTALTSAAAASVTGLPCSGFTAAGNGCADTLAIAHASDSEGEEGEEEAAEEGGEEAASAEAEAEEAESGTAGSPSNRASGPNAVVLSKLKLTAKAAAALRRHRPSASAIEVSFTLSAPARVHATLLEQTSVHGQRRWSTLPDSLTISAARGHVSRSLKGHNRLPPGRYRLTVKPAAGHSRSIYLSARR